MYKIGTEFISNDGAHYSFKIIAVSPANVYTIERGHGSTDTISHEQLQSQVKHGLLKVAKGKSLL